MKTKEMKYLLIICLIAIILAIPNKSFAQQETIKDKYILIIKKDFKNMKYIFETEKGIYEFKNKNEFKAIKINSKINVKNYKKIKDKSFLKPRNYDEH